MHANLAQWFAAAEKNDELYILGNIGAYAGAKNNKGETALMIAAYHDHAHLVAKLCPYEARCQDNTGKAAIHVAIERDNYDMCTVLGPHERGVLINNDMNPYHLAARLGKPRAMDALGIFFGAERDSNGLTAIEHAAIGECAECLELALNNRKMTAKDIMRARVYAEENCLPTRMINIINDKLGECDAIDVAFATSSVCSNSPNRGTASMYVQSKVDVCSVRSPDYHSYSRVQDDTQDMRQITGSFRCVPINPHSPERERIDELIAAKDELLQRNLESRLSSSPRNRSPALTPKPVLNIENDDRIGMDPNPIAVDYTRSGRPTSPLGMNSYRSPPPAPPKFEFIPEEGDNIDGIISTLDNVARQTKEQEDYGMPLPTRVLPQSTISRVPMEPLEKLTGSFTASAFLDNAVREAAPIPKLPMDNFEYKEYPDHSRSIDMGKPRPAPPVDTINAGLEKLTASHRIVEKGLSSKTATLISEYDPRTSQYKAAIDKANEVISSNIEPAGPYKQSVRAPSKNRAVRNAMTVLEQDALPTIEEVQKSMRSQNTLTTAVVPPLATTIPSDEGRAITQSFVGGQPLMSNTSVLESSLRFHNTGAQAFAMPPPVPNFDENVSVDQLIASHKQNHPTKEETKGKFTSLMRAAIENDISAAKVLVVTYARAQDPNGKTAMMYAAERGHAEIVNLLLPFEGGMQLKNGGTALMHALGNGHLTIASMLMGCDGGLAMDDGWTALMSAATINADNIIVGLLDKEAGMVCNSKHKEGEGYCACMIAAKKNNLEALRLLASREGHITNYMGQNALSFARTMEARELLSLFG